MIIYLLLETLKLLVYMMCAVILGLIIPLMISTLLVYTTELTFRECIISVPFGWTTVILTIDGFKHLNRMVENYNSIQAQINKQQQPKQQQNEENKRSSSS